MSNWTLKEKSQGELTVTIEGATWTSAQEKAFDKLAKNVEIKGFRKGQAPKSMVEKQINKNQILIEAVDFIAQEALITGVEEHNITLVARPELKLDEITEEKVTLTFVCTVKPEVTLGNYKGLTYEVSAVEVTEEEVNAEIARLQERFAELEVKEGGEVENGDTAIIDFEGFLNEEAFEGGKGENHPLVIGSNQFIPGFEEQLIGAKEGAEVEVNVTFPEEYHAENLKGQAVVFKVKVNEIKVNKLPELNEEFVAEVNMPEVKTVEELKAAITKNMTDSKTAEAENDATNKVLDELMENVTVELPDAMIEEEKEEMLKDYGMRLQQQGFSLEQFMQMTGQTAETMKEQFTVDAEKRIKLRLTLEAIVKAEDIQVEEEKINEEYTKIAEMYGMEVDKVKELIQVEVLAQNLKMEKALDIVKGK